MSAEEVVHHYRTNAVGWLELRVATKGVRSISFISQPSQPVKSTQHPVMQKLISELDQYFANTLTTFSVPLDPETGTLFQRRVWQELALIPYGKNKFIS